MSWFTNLWEKTAADTANQLPELKDLETLSQQAKAKNLPIMLMFGATYCPFCHQLRDEVLNPMMLSDLYEGHLMFMREVNIDDATPIKDWQGKTLSKADWANQIHATLTPTMIFINSQQQEIAPRIVGTVNLDEYTTEIHDRLNQAYQTLNNPKHLPATAHELEMQHSKI